MSRLLPEMARRLPQTAVSISIIDNPNHLFAAVVDFLSQSPTSGDKPRLLHYVSQRIGRFSWLLIGAYRTEEVDDTPARALLIADLARHDARHIQLSPLTAVDIEALTVHLWTRLAAGYRGHIAAMLAQATGGNALFVTAVSPYSQFIDYLEQGEAIRSVTCRHSKDRGRLHRRHVMAWHEHLFFVRIFSRSIPTHTEWFTPVSVNCS